VSAPSGNHQDFLLAGPVVDEFLRAGFPCVGLDVTESARAAVTADGVD
jgi:hypothetical protein